MTSLGELQNALGDRLAVDTETTSLDEMRADLVGISLCVDAGVACYIPVGHRQGGGDGDEGGGRGGAAVGVGEGVAQGGQARRGGWRGGVEESA